MSILQKLDKARRIIRTSNLTKRGRNEYSKYDYFTPSQVSSLVDKACEQAKMITLCNLRADEHGLYQELELVDLEDEKQRVKFEMRTEKGEITATNATQQMGGTDTYSERYIKMKVFQIVDNSLDPDSQDNREVNINPYLDKLEKCMTDKELMSVWHKLPKELKANKIIIAKAKDVKELINENS